MPPPPRLGDKKMKLIILDRDGVINYDSAQFIKSEVPLRPRVMGLKVGMNF